jgi:hypothetical protein
LISVFICTIEAYQGYVQVNNKSIITGEKASFRSDSTKVGNVFYTNSPILISKDYKDAPYKQLKTHLAIILEISRSGENEKWYRVLCSDGHVGWIKNPDGLSTPSQISTKALAINMLSPDDIDFYSSAPQHYNLTNEQKGVITGASRSSRVGTPFMNSIPEQKNPFNSPWLNIQIDSLTGWSPPYYVDVFWDEVVGSTRNTNLFDLNRLGLTGIIRSPFLGPVNKVLETEKPKVKRTVFYADHNLETLSNVVWTLPNAFGKVAYFIRDVDDNEDAISTVIVYLDSTSELLTQNETKKAFSFLSKNGTSKHLILNSNASTIVDYKKVDLDNDGFKEWIIELLFAYSDGYYSTMMIVDGKSLKNRLVIKTLDLGGACGEPGCDSNVDSYWWVDKSNDSTARLFRVFSHQDKVSTDFASFRYSRNIGLKQVATKKLYAVSLGESNENLDAQKLSVAISKKLNYDNLYVFPRNQNSHIIWSVGRIFEVQKDALSWIKALKNQDQRAKLLALTQHVP